MMLKAAGVFVVVVVTTALSSTMPDMKTVYLGRDLSHLVLDNETGKNKTQKMLVND